jgi:hypothetical protein
MDSWAKYPPQMLSILRIAGGGALSLDRALRGKS